MAALQTPQELARQAFFTLTVRQLQRLFRLVRRQIAAYETAGELMPGELSPEDVIDEVVLRAYREFVREPERRRTATWLERVAREQLETERRRLEGERERSIHIEEDIPETPPREETSMLGEEILYYHQPDDDLKAHKPAFHRSRIRL